MTKKEAAQNLCKQELGRGDRHAIATVPTTVTAKRTKIHGAFEINTSPAITESPLSRAKRIASLSNELATPILDVLPPETDLVTVTFAISPKHRAQIITNLNTVVMEIHFFLKERMQAGGTSVETSLGFWMPARGFFAEVHV